MSRRSRGTCCLIDQAQLGGTGVYSGCIVIACYRVCCPVLRLCAYRGRRAKIDRTTNHEGTLQHPEQSCDVQEQADPNSAGENVITSFLSSNCLSQSYCPVIAAGRLSLS